MSGVVGGHGQWSNRPRGGRSGIKEGMGEFFYRGSVWDPRSPKGIIRLS